jgi:O-antigen/teichoic acid export membrane protein
MAVLARLLTLQDFGLISMVTAFTGLASLFRDMGLSMATVQRPHIDHAQVSTLFWVNVAISVVITSITAMLGPLIAWFYGEPRLKWITIVSAVAFIFGGLTVQHQALLRRQMRFTALAIIDVGSMLAGIIVAITSSLYGAGYWALVLNQLVVGITTAMGVWLLCDWRPGLPVGHSGVRSMLAFGGNLTGANVLNYFVRNFDNILIGWYWGAQQLGLYTRAYQLLVIAQPPHEIS